MKTRRIPPTLEALGLYAQAFNDSLTIKHFGAVIDFPDLTRVRATIDPIPKQFRGGMGSASVVNGGVLAAMFDLALGCAAALSDPTCRTGTMQLSMSFMRPLTGTRLVAEARVDRAGDETLFTSATIRNDKDEICAQAQAVVKLTHTPWIAGTNPAVN